MPDRRRRAATSQTSRTLRFDLGRGIRETRRALGWTQDRLARQAGISSSMVCRIERGTVNCSLDAASRVCDALGIRVAVRLDGPLIAGDHRQRDPVHARCSGYVRRKLATEGWTVAGEVEIISGRSHGWIDLLAWHSSSGTALVVEVKTELRDIGQIERTIGWYEREAWAAARRLGWHPSRVASILVILMTDAVEDRIQANAGILAAAFGVRGSALADRIADPGSVWRRGERGLALIDPVSRRRTWLRASRTDGRRTPSPYIDYVDALRSLARPPDGRSSRRLDGSVGRPAAGPAI